MHDGSRGRGTGSQVLSSNVEVIRQLEEQSRAHRTLGVRLSEVVTHVLGSVPCVLLHLVGLGLWCFINLGGARPLVEPFDPFPFGILTLFVSAEGVLLAIFVLISQNRLTRDADRRAHLALQISLLTEQSATKTLQSLQRIMRAMNLPEADGDEEAASLAEPTNLNEVIDQIDRSLGTG
jgi:uncharacterized membrane protein